MKKQKKFTGILFLLTVFIISTLFFTSSVLGYYTIKDLGTLGGNSSFAFSINNINQIVGRSTTYEGYEHPFLWNNDVMADLGTLAGNISNSWAWNINDIGQVAGQSGIRAFLWNNSVMTDIGTLGGNEGYAYGINNMGKIVGRSTNNQGYMHAFLWNNGMMNDIGTIGGGNYSWAHRINNIGQIVGGSEDIYGNTHAFLWDNGIMFDLGGLGYNYSDTRDINDNSYVVGASSVLGGIHAFLWNNGMMNDLGTLGGSSSFASGINNINQVVGWAYLTGDNQHAFLWDNGVITDLNSLLPSGSDWVLSTAYDINDAGLIVGIGNRYGQTHAFLMTPVIPEPATFILFTGGIFGMVVLRRKKR